MKLIINCIIVGTIVIAIIIGLFIFRSHFQDILSWVPLIISIGSGIIIALIVDDRAKQSHNEVTTSQDKIAKLINKLDDTDKKHNQMLDFLEQSNKTNKELATHTLILSMEYIADMLSKLFKCVDPEDIQGGDNKLIKNLLTHLESPLNLIIQVFPNTGDNFREMNDELLSVVNTLRKLVIASTIVTDKDDRTVKALARSKERFDEVFVKVKNSHV